MLSANQVTSRVGTSSPAGTFDPPVANNALDRLMASPSRLDRLAPPPSHVVAKGDTLSAIADKHGTTWQTLARINGLSHPDRLTIGQSIRLPEGVASGHAAVHVVRSGETLSGIAHANGTDVATLSRTNHLSDPDRIAVGQSLRLTGSAPAVAAAPVDRKSTRLNSSHVSESRMPSSA